MDTLAEKWAPVLDHADLPSITDAHKRRVTAVLLENQMASMKEERAGGNLFEATMGPIGMGGNPITGQVGAAGNFAGYDPVLISLVRRAMPNVVAYDIAGVQPMSAPTGLIFAMRARYGADTATGYTLGTEALFDEPWAKFSGACGASAGLYTTQVSGATLGVFTTAAMGNGVTYITRTDTFSQFRGMLTSTAETLGQNSASTDFREMAFSIERIAVQARSRALKAEYTTELAQDLRAVHGLDAEAELANILSVEIMNEINREILRAMYFIAKTGCQNADLAGVVGSGAGGVYDLVNDSDGRWSAERFRGLMFQIEREANQIAKDTRRGKGNFIVCSADVASALAMGGFLNLSPALNVDMQVDDTGNVFAGVLNNKFKVYIDPFVANNVNFVTVGYKGTSPYDAGFFYCPYVPLQMVRAVGQDTFQPKIGFKTRYGLVGNPFAQGRDPFTANQVTQEGLIASTNAYYRLFAVTNLHGNTA
ncbi:MAG: ATP-binding protein [Terrimicrobiaceae bacterium]